jgi:small nuclear ribonucleoprotein (snRNP)-like protein
MASKIEREAVLDFAKYTDQRVRVRFQGGREVDGILKGYDKLDNLVLDDTVEYLRGNYRPRVPLARHPHDSLLAPPPLSLSCRSQ